MIIDEIKVGDILVATVRTGERSLVVVSRINKRFFEAGGRQWGKGGSPYPASDWLTSHLEIPRPGEIDAVHREKLTRRLARKLASINWRDFPLETLEAVIALLPEESKE